MEPPIPPNLKKLSPALTSLTEFFKIDMDMVAIAAESSPSKRAKTEPIADWIAALPEGDRNAYLLRVAQGEPNVGAELMQRLRQEFGTTPKATGVTTGRTLADIIAMADAYKKERKKQEKAAAKKVRRQYLQRLVPKVDQMWTDVFRLIGYKQAKPYDEAVEILKDLRDIAKMKGQSDQFGDRIIKLMADYSNRPGLLRRIRDANLQNTE